MRAWVARPIGVRKPCRTKRSRNIRSKKQGPTHPWLSRLYIATPTRRHADSRASHVHTGSLLARKEQEMHTCDKSICLLLTRIPTRHPKVTTQSPQRAACSELANGEVLCTRDRSCWLRGCCPVWNNGDCVWSGAVNVWSGANNWLSGADCGCNGT